MQENTNRAIAYNSVVLYARLAITTICSLITTRFALQALGVVDFGLYAVLGSIISFIAIFNTIMVSTSNRFISVAIGKGDMVEINKQFNVNFIVHVLIAIVALLVALPLGEWYIPRFVQYDGPMENAMMVYIISILGSIVSFVGVPYNGLLMAKEKFIVFGLVEVIASILKLFVAWFLVDHLEQKLLVYTIAMAILTAMHTVVYIVYCSHYYPQIVHLKFVREKNMYIDVFKFSSWVSLGAVASIGKSQGAALIVNTFFSTVMNTAMGLATGITHYINLFASSVVQPMQPQITKSFASGDIHRTDELLIMSTKFSFLLTFLVGSFFLVAPEWILKLWLGDIPPFTVIFLKLFVIDQLVQSFNMGISNVIWASGKIGRYQILTSMLNFLAIIIGYYVLRGGAPAYYLVVTYICFSIARFFAIQWSLRRTLHYNNSILWRHSYVPSLLVVILYSPIFLVLEHFSPIVNIVLSFIYICILIWFIGLTKNERAQLFNFISKR